jgi:hypothetical protein
VSAPRWRISERARSGGVKPRREGSRPPQQAHNHRGSTKQVRNVYSMLQCRMHAGTHAHDHPPGQGRRFARSTARSGP